MERVINSLQKLITEFNSAKRMTNTADLCDEYFYALRSLIERKVLNIKRIAVVGYYSSGKSTFINTRLILKGVQAQLTGISEVNSIPTVVRPSDKDAFKRWDAKGYLCEASPKFVEGLSKLKVSQIDDILKEYFQGEMEFVREVKKNPIMRDCEYLDLPGISGIASTIYDKALKAGIIASDGIIYLIKAKDGLKENDKRFIIDNVPEGMSVAVVITNLDLLPSSQKEDKLSNIRKDVEAILKEKLIGIAEMYRSNDRNEHDETEVVHYETDVEQEYVFYALKSIIDINITIRRVLTKINEQVLELISQEGLPLETKNNLLRYVSEIADKYPGSMPEIEILADYKLPNDEEGKLQLLVKNCLRLTKDEIVKPEEIEECKRDLVVYVNNSKVRMMKVWEIGHNMGKPLFGYLLYLAVQDAEKKVNYLIKGSENNCLIAQHEISYSSLIAVPIVRTLITEKLGEWLQFLKIQKMIWENLANKGYIDAMISLGCRLAEIIHKQYDTANNWWGKAGSYGYGNAYALIAARSTERQKYIELAAKATYPDPNACVEYAKILWMQKKGGEALYYINIAYNDPKTKQQVESWLKVNQDKTYFCTKYLQTCKLSNNRYMIYLIAQFDKAFKLNKSYEPLRMIYNLSAPLIIQAVDKIEDNNKIWCMFAQDYLVSVFSHIEAKRYELAVRVYAEGVRSMAKQYLNNETYEQLEVLYKEFGG